MKGEIFIDTSYVIALSSEKDCFHAKAVEVAQRLKSAKSKLITTRPVLLEIGNALSGLRFRSAAIKLLNASERDKNIGIVPLSESLYHKGLDLFSQRQDKSWGLVDCISFVVMQERKITEALTTDEHFQRAGFRAILRE